MAAEPPKLLAGMAGEGFFPPKPLEGTEKNRVK